MQRARARKADLRGRDDDDDGDLGELARPRKAVAHFQFAIFTLLLLVRYGDATLRILDCS